MATEDQTAGRVASGGATTIASLVVVHWLDPALHSCLRVHPDDLPDVPVEIVEAPAEHEPVIHHWPCLDRAPVQSRVHHFIDLGLTLHG